MEVWERFSDSLTAFWADEPPSIGLLCEFSEVRCSGFSRHVLMGNPVLISSTGLSSNSNPSTQGIAVSVIHRAVSMTRVIRHLGNNVALRTSPRGLSPLLCFSKRWRNSVPKTYFKTHEEHILVFGLWFEGFFHFDIHLPCTASNVWD